MSDMDTADLSTAATTMTLPLLSGSSRHAITRRGGEEAAAAVEEGHEDHPLLLSAQVAQGSLHPPPETPSLTTQQRRRRRRSGGRVFSFLSPPARRQAAIICALSLMAASLLAVWYGFTLLWAIFTCKVDWQQQSTINEFLGMMPVWGGCGLMGVYLSWFTLHLMLHGKVPATAGAGAGAGEEQDPDSLAQWETLRS